MNEKLSDRNTRKMCLLEQELIKKFPNKEKDKVKEFFERALITDNRRVFVASEIAKVLETDIDIEKFDNNEKVSVKFTNANGEYQDIIFLTEDGLDRLIYESNNQEYEIKFKKWLKKYNSLLEITDTIAVGKLLKFC